MGGVVGLQLQSALPEGYSTGGARDMIGAVTGLVTLLLALVLGLLIWTAFGVYSTQKASIQTVAIYDLKFDAALNYLPTTRPRRLAEGAEEYLWIGASVSARSRRQNLGRRTRRRLGDKKLSLRAL